MMRLSITSILLPTAITVSPALAGQKVQAAWMGTNFNTVSGPGGSGTAGHASGFALLDEDGKDIYNADYPDGYAACTAVGQNFKLDGGCLKDAVYSFKCTSSESGIPKNCEVLDGHGGSLGKGKGDYSTSFFGIGIADGGGCSVDFELADNINCGEQGGLTGHHQ
ncbi:hypothetical protein N7507_007089 [Penicillium longicatenatum]|nr:hypothetical protein N7507_007089 [Penicillium longicatenatum]